MRVQGEVRDIIIFSTGYTKDLTNPEEKIGVQFGSLNRQDGEKYLNVAITRVRREIITVITVCSFDPNRIKVDDAKHGGPQRLNDYMRYAKSISEGHRQETNSILKSLHPHQSNKNIENSESEQLLEELICNELQVGL